MTAQPRQILIADPDLESVRLLSRAIRERGHRVHLAPDGSRALEVAVLRRPDLVLFDEACQILDAKTFVQILRTNPRTANIPVVLTTASPGADERRAFRDGVLTRPLNLDEVLARIDHHVRRSETAKDLRSESEIDGNLSQLGISDLLQILAVNKRSGRLALSHQGERGEIHVGEGRPMNAKIGPVEGEKALFRMLSWTEGTFSFTPAPPPPRDHVNRGMEDALLEGARHTDEMVRLLPSLPPRTARIHLAPDADLGAEQHPVTSQVLELLQQPRALSELVDLAPATDLDVLSVVSTLLQKGVVRIAEGEQDDAAEGPLLGPAEVHALRTRLFRGRTRMRADVAKIFLCGGAPETAGRVLAGVPRLRPIGVGPPAMKSGFGTLGRCEISEGLHIDFCLLPAVEAARPLWRPFSAGAVGALLLDDSPQAARLAHWLAVEARVPIVVIGGPVPPLLNRAPAGAMAVGTNLLEALRAVLIQSLNPVQPFDAARPLAPAPG